MVLERLKEEDQSFVFGLNPWNGDFWNLALRVMGVYIFVLCYNIGKWTVTLHFWRLFIYVPFISLSPPLCVCVEGVRIYCLSVLQRRIHSCIPSCAVKQVLEGPGRWGRACGSVGCGEGGMPPGGQSGLGRTWLLEIKMTVEQSRPCAWFSTIKVCF